jgi:hypothetical protein
MIDTDVFITPLIAAFVFIFIDCFHCTPLMFLFDFSLAAIDADDIISFGYAFADGWLLLRYYAFDITGCLMPLRRHFQLRHCRQRRRFIFACRHLYFMLPLSAEVRCRR